MELLKKFDYQEHKSKCLFLISFSIGIFILYYLIFLPFQNYTNKKDRANSFEVKIRKEEKINQANNQKHSKMIEELEKTKKYYSDLENKNIKNSFKNISSFEKFISEKAQLYNLNIETIGKVEKISETDKLFIPYILNGDISDILSFIEELENNDKKISLTDSSTNISLLPHGKITTKLSANILNLKEEELKENNLLPISKLSNNKITKIKYIKFNDKIYIILNYKNGSKKIFYNGEEIVFNNLKYKIILNNNSPFLELIKN